ncbi:hypothetical protein ACE14D_18215, partial [Streptomyces sp. Act-28]
MTTTLRPSGPLQQADDGTLSRSYEVCVNSRPVGAVRIGTLRARGRPLGTISDLRVEEADRGRGRGPPPPPPGGGGPPPPPPP